MRNFIFPIMAKVVLLLSAATAIGQDSHYWDNQYGTTSELLGGIVIGSSTDLSATYYNPGWISLQKGAAVLLTTKAIETYTIEVGSNLNIDAEPASTTFAASPGYFAARFSIGNDYGWKWAYSYLQKVKFEYYASAIDINSNSSPEPGENFWDSTELFRDVSSDESWYGLSLSRKLADNIGLGFSPFGVYRYSRSRSQIALQNLTDSSVYSDAYLVDEYTYSTLRLLMKIGVAAEWEKLSVGMAITTPSLHIIGSGMAHQNLSFSGDYLPGDPIVDEPFLRADHQEDIDAIWKSPLSVAVGAAYIINKTKVHLSLEWFDSVSAYKVIAAESYEVQSLPGTEAEYTLVDGAKSVVNYGIGFDRPFTETLSLFFSYRMDRSNALDSRNESLGVTIWDLKHVSTGAAFDFLGLEFTAGVQYSWGEGLSDRLVDISFEDDSLLPSEYLELEYEYTRLKLLLGFNLPFGENDDNS